MAEGKASFEKVVSISTSSTGTYSQIPASDMGLNREGDLLDDTDLTSSGTRSRILGLRDWSVSGTVNFSTVSGYTKIKDAYDNRDTLWVRYLPAGSSLSSMGYHGEVQVENDNLSGGVGDLEQSDVSLQATGPLMATSSTI